MKLIPFSRAFLGLTHLILCVAVCMVLMMFTVDAHAQDKQNIRASNNTDYSRLVFDLGGGMSYDVAKENTALVFDFNKAVKTNIASTEDIKNIGTVSVLSDDPLKVSVQIAKDSKYRHFKIGNRIILDVYNSSNAPSRAAAQQKETTPEVADVKDDPKTPPPSEASLEEEKPQADARADLGREPFVITVSATKNVGLAVFERAGYLWVVQDNPSLKVPPTVSGRGSKAFPDFEEVEIKAGKAYRMALPQKTNFYGEGGGLLWRIIMSPNPRNNSALRMEVRERKVVDGLESSIFWPLRNAAKVVDVRDPLIGDIIKVITVGDSAQTIGPARQFVDMQLLKSTIGVALVPLVDDLKIDLNADGVSLSTPTGLALSPNSDTVALNIKSDVQKEDEYFDAMENPQDMSQIFDFGRWEMGGLKSLDENRRILMVGIANTQSATKVEDLITLAKLNLANDRGQEALGLLRVAEQELPGIELTPEFLALKGASNVLASKFDEAIEDLMQPALEQYDEISYWKSAALAGLEDWQQAGKMMPSRLGLLDEYPTQIKQPLALKMIETALRNANLAAAEELLAMLEPQFLEMSVARQSAWKYLQGELERQRGNPEAAMQNWETLLTGKDDYYRAKAGLSVTRMQLERQKVTPAKAIDRLEGLRYAWRGDELETLINLRLGEVYIENKDYLKGLSVLRGAIGISPNSKISEEVTNYMTDTFRALFTEGALDEMSPLDAVTIFDEFKELTPIGDDGNIFVQNLANRLADVDLLGRASALLADQVDYRLQGQEKGRVGVRLAAIYLMDNKPDEAIAVLNKAQSAILNTNSTEIQREIKLLQARALSKKGQANKALGMLRGLPATINLAKLKADIAWNGGLWNDAANAFGDLIGYQNISLTRPMDEYEENLILNRAIALNLSSNRTALADLRAKYGDLIKQSEKQRIFELVTRPRQLGVLDDRAAITSLISEVDLFGDFLENYKSSQ